ncbi:MAG: histidine phosphatase family protein [Clostridia bacterium]|nr:histidine phosphatase family protein [Clostridia bacterium]
MRILFVRHGEPDYATDSLTETGKEQARLVAERLLRENITEIYVSSMYRATQTAAPRAEKLGLDVTVLPYMHETAWGSKENRELPMRGHPWFLAETLLNEGYVPTDDNWREHDYFRDNLATDLLDVISTQIDELIAAHGFTRTGRLYKVADDVTPGKTIALFSHGGSGASALSHILNIPYPYIMAAMPYQFTSVTAVTFPDMPGKTVFPRLSLFNDVGHLSLAPEKKPTFDR